MIDKSSLAAIAIALTVALSGCASSSLVYSGLVTASPEEPPLRDAPIRSVPLKDRVTIVTRVASPDDERSGSTRHAVRWNWYEGRTLIAEQNKTLEFPKTPYRFSRSLAASDLGIGRYRVEVVVDGVRVDEQDFEIVAR